MGASGEARIPCTWLLAASPGPFSVRAWGRLGLRLATNRTMTRTTPLLTLLLATALLAAAPFAAETAPQAAKGVQEDHGGAPGDVTVVVSIEGPEGLPWRPPLPR